MIFAGERKLLLSNGTASATAGSPPIRFPGPDTALGAIGSG